MDRRIGRRRFLGTAGRIGAGAVLGSIPLLNGCKSSPTGPDEPPEPAVPVDLEFTIYNHTQGPRGNFRRTGVLSGTTLEFNVAALISEFGITDVYDRSICIRESETGTRVDVSRGGGVARLVAPRIDMRYDIFLFNRGGQEFYAAVEALSIHPRLWFGRTPRAFRMDNGLGEERVWGGEYVPEIGEYGVFDQLNKALKPEWAPWSYGHIERKPAPNDNQGNFAYGFGDCNGYDATVILPSNSSSIWWVGIDPMRVPDIKTQIERGLVYASGVIFGSSQGFKFPGQSGYPVIQENGILNDAFKDYLPYIFLAI